MWAELAEKRDQFTLNLNQFHFDNNKSLKSITPKRIKKAGREGGTSGNLRRATGTITGDETPEYQ